MLGLRGLEMVARHKSRGKENHRIAALKKLTDVSGKLKTCSGKLCATKRQLESISLLFLGFSQWKELTEDP